MCVCVGGGGGGGGGVGGGGGGGGGGAMMGGYKLYIFFQHLKGVPNFYIFPSALNAGTYPSPSRKKYPHPRVVRVLFDMGRSGQDITMTS